MPPKIQRRRLAPLPPELETRYAELATRVLRVERPRLAAARDAIRGLSDPSEAWETLTAREITPLDWIDDAARRFEDPRDGAPLPWPATLHTCATFAGDPIGVATAEALARETARRLARWSDTDAPRAPPSACLWRCIPADEWRPSEPGPADVLASALEDPDHPEAATAFAVVYQRIPAGGRAPDRALERLARDVRLAEQWRTAVARGVVLARRVLAEQPDPFEPLLALWATGYALDAITADALVLIASEV